MINSPICEILGIEYPIFQGGMAWIADGKLAAAVSNAGGLGIISAMNANATNIEESIKKMPVVVDDEIVIRPMMAIQLSFDHRIVDGGPAAKFLARIKEFIEEPTLML